MIDSKAELIYGIAKELELTDQALLDLCYRLKRLITHRQMNKVEKRKAIKLPFH